MHDRSRTQAEEASTRREPARQERGRPCHQRRGEFAHSVKGPRRCQPRASWGAEGRQGAGGEPQRIATQSYRPRRGAGEVEEVSMATAPLSSNEHMESELSMRLAAISKELKTDILAFIGPINTGIDDVFRRVIEGIQNKTKDISIILETHGGYIEVTERIVDLIRHHYTGEVSFVVPNFAMSAGTILALSGDHILMDYYSILGPIDPQIENRSGQTVPALGYLNKYQELVRKSQRGQLSTAELAYFIDKFDPGEMDSFEQARDLTVDLLKKWLVRYKFKNWTKTKTKNKKVTVRMRERRAEQIARQLSDTRMWRSHGRGLSMSVLQNDLNLVIVDFGKDQKLNSCIRDYYRLLQDYQRRRAHSIVFHVPGRYIGY